VSSSPPAAGVRMPFADLPPRIRSGIEARAGADIVAAADQVGGFSPGAAARLRLAGYLAQRSRQPAPPGLPTPREFQRSCAASALTWLRRRTGWAGSDR
jgi:hypothetical protein